VKDRLLIVCEEKSRDQTWFRKTQDFIKQADKIKETQQFMRNLVMVQKEIERIKETRA
jgi:hypothetical protein